MIRRILSSGLKNKIRTYFLKGDMVECSTCSVKLITFLPSGIPPRANAVCPNCESLERTRIYWKYLTQLPDFFSSKKKVLHAAPEKVLFELFSNSSNIEYEPIDKFEPGYNYPTGTKNMDILNLEYPDNHFDFILCSHVLEHIDDDIKAMKEFYRVLSSKGFAILQVPMDESQEKTFEDFTITDPEERTKAFGQYDHVRLYGLDYKERLEKAGFNVEINDFSKEMTSEEKFRYGFAQGESLYIVRK